MKLLRTVAGEVGKGLLAGLAGTAVMTVASSLEAKLRKRPASGTPAAAAERVLGISAPDARSKRRLSNAVHFAYGTAWGLARAVLGRSLGGAGIKSPFITAGGHLAAVWGTELVMLPALGLTPPVRKWGVKEVVIDGVHHLIYAAAVDGAYRAIDRF